MDTLTSLENIPTQEKKFRNFAANSLRLKKSDEKVVTQIWELLMKERQKETETVDEQKSENKPVESANISDEENSKESKYEQSKAKEKTSGTANDSSDVELPSDSSVKKVIKSTLKKAPNRMLKFKQLRKEVKRSLLLNAENDKAKSHLENVKPKKWKALVTRIVEDNPKKLKVDGKSVKLMDC
jgi:hypothetical protein